MSIETYWKEYERQYSGDEWFEKVLVAARRRRVLESAARNPARHVLEIGCGMESLVSSWGPFEQFTIVEPVEEFCARARQAAPDGSEVTVLCGYLEEQTDALAERAPFDLIVASSLLHEVPDPRRLLVSIASLCSTSTVVHLNVPNVRSFHRLLALEMGQIADLFERSEMEKRFGRVTRFDRATLETMLHEAGFLVRHFETYFVKPFTHRQMEQIVDAKILPVEVIAALDRMAKYMPDLGCEMFVELTKR